ncbi:Retron-type reverse transcriptase [Methanophagales archaeon]|nr:Retron-type reverse transcriptase [Methanophagales archaeon]
MYDRAMQALYALSLSPVAEATADPYSFGFRKYRSAQDACQYAFICLSHKNSAQWVLEGDIKGCFDNINHEWILDNIQMDKSILKQFLKAGFVYNRYLNPIIIGWSNYHRSVVSKEVFSNLDYRMWNMLWRWAKRRHQDKNSKTWIVRKYWHSEGSRNWMFSTKKNRLKLFSDTKMVRDTSLKLDKNPYLDSEYFKLRKLRQKALKLSEWCKTRWGE